MTEQLTKICTETLLAHPIFYCAYPLILTIMMLGGLFLYQGKKK